MNAAIPAWVLYVTAVGTLVLVVAAVLKKIIVPFFQACGSLYNRIEIILLTVNNISLEFKNNHGSSLKDSVDRIEAKADAAKVLAGDAAAKATQLAGTIADMTTTIRGNVDLLREIHGHTQVQVVIPDMQSTATAVQANTAAVDHNTEVTDANTEVRKQS